MAPLGAHRAGDRGSASANGGHCASSPSRCAYSCATATVRASSSARRAPSSRSPRESAAHVGGEAVPGAEVTGALGRRGPAPTPDPATRPTAGRPTRARHEPSARRRCARASSGPPASFPASPTAAPRSGSRRSPARSRAAAPPATRPARAGGDEQDPRLAHPQRRAPGPAGDLGEVRRREVPLVQADRGRGPVPRELEPLPRARARRAPRSRRSPRGRPWSAPAAGRPPRQVDAPATAASASNAASASAAIAAIAARAPRPRLHGRSVSGSWAAGSKSTSSVVAVGPRSRVRTICGHDRARPRRMGGPGAGPGADPSEPRLRADPSRDRGARAGASG